MTSNEFASSARAHEHALRFAGALLETAARLAIVAVVLSAVVVRITIALGIRAVRLHTERPALFSVEHRGDFAMRYFRTLGFIAVLAAAAGCASLPELRVDRDPGTDLSSYRTFAFFAHVATDGDGAYTTIVSEHLKKATRSELERLGYVYDERSPQLRVNFFLNVQQRQEIQGAPGVVGLLRGVRTVEYKAGTLGIDIVDERRSSLVWQGVAEGRVPREARDDPGATIGKIVAEIFANFPRPAAT